MLRRLRLLVLPVLLLLAQHGALVHEVTHATRVSVAGLAGASASYEPSGGIAQDTCGLCIAYAGLAYARAADETRVVEIALVDVRPSAPRVGCRDEDAPVARSRGPPLDV